MKVTITIETGNDAMKGDADIARALEQATVEQKIDVPVNEGQMT